MVPAGPEHIYAELESPSNLARILNVEIEAGWPPGEYDRGAQEFFLNALNEGGTEATGWYAWYAIRRSTSGKLPVLIGAAGYLGPPNEAGSVEIGFSVMPSWRGQGYASEIAEFLTGNAFADSRVTMITAHTSDQNPASCRVLEKAGFKRTGDVENTGSVCYVIQRDSLSSWNFP